MKWTMYIVLFKSKQVRCLTVCLYATAMILSAESALCATYELLFSCDFFFFSFFFCFVRDSHVTLWFIFND